MLIENQVETPHEFVDSLTYSSTLKAVEKKNLNRIINGDKKPTLEWIDFEDIEPLETQRETKSNWIVQRLEDRGGLDMLAFQTLSIARDPETRKNNCFDGLGRYSIAHASGYRGKVPCVVYEMTQQEAAFYFSYIQNRGRRNLPREVTFVNSWFAGEKEALELGDILAYCGLYVQGNTHYPVPHPKKSNTAEITYRTIKEGYDKISEKNADLCKLARDMIYSAYDRTDSGCQKIAQDFYWAVLQILVTYPDARSGALQKSMQKYIDYVAMGNSQTGATSEWKGNVKGISGNSGVSKILAYNFLKAFRKSNFANGTVIGSMPLNALGVKEND